MNGGLDDCTHGGPFFTEMPTDPRPGIYGKFTIKRTDGQSAPGEKHNNCDYFVLDLTHDHHAGPAIAAYIESCREEFPQLAADLNRWLIAHNIADKPV